MAADSIKEKGGRMKIFGRLPDGALAPLTTEVSDRLNSRKSGPFGGSFAFIEVEKVFAKTNALGSDFH